MIKFSNSGQLALKSEQKVASGIHQMVKTSQDDFALATQTGLCFHKYDALYRKFQPLNEFFICESIVTQVF